MQITLPNGHILISVPKDAHNFRKAFSEFCHPTLLYEIFETNLQVKSFDFDFEILGTVTKDTIDFDCEGIGCKKEKPEYKQEQKYSDYDQMISDWLNDTRPTFRSLLQSLGIYFENPLGEEPSCINNDVWYSYERWEDAQSKVIDKAVILKLK